MEDLEQVFRRGWRELSIEVRFADEAGGEAVQVDGVDARDPAEDGCEMVAERPVETTEQHLSAALCFVSRGLGREDGLAGAGTAGDDDRVVFLDGVQYFGLLVGELDELVVDAAQCEPQ